MSYTQESNEQIKNIKKHYEDKLEYQGTRLTKQINTLEADGKEMNETIKRLSTEKQLNKTETEATEIIKLTEYLCIEKQRLETRESQLNNITEILSNEERKTKELENENRNLTGINQGLNKEVGFL